jgi:outer membrane PBP1 activator LpoA protein
VTAGQTLPAGSEMLFAMGADAQQLYLRLPLMQANPNLLVSGNTGYLYLDAHRRVERKLDWATLQGGQALPMPVISGAQ